MNTIIGWAWLIAVPAILLVIAAAILRMNYRDRVRAEDVQKMKDYMEALVEHTKIASERAGGAMTVGVETSKRVDELTKLPVTVSRSDFPPPPVAPLSSLGMAVGLILVASALSMATVRKETTVMSQPASESIPPAELVAIATRHMEAGEHYNAMIRYLAASRAGHEPRECLFRAAECAFYCKDYARANRLCDELTKTVPGCGEADHIRGLVCEAQGDVEGAVGYWKTARARGYLPSNVKLQTRGAT